MTQAQGWILIAVLLGGVLEISDRLRRLWVKLDEMEQRGPQ